MWRAGQIVTINHNRYRVTKAKPHQLASCARCALFGTNENVYPCSECINHIPELMPADCFLTEIKPKS